MTVPASVAEGIRSRWPHLADPWLDAVEDELAGLCQTFAARPVRVFPSRYSYAVAAESLDGPLVFRGTPDPAGTAQAEISCSLARRGAGPEVHAIRTTPTGHWTVMDRVLPGQPIGDLRSSRKPVAELAQALNPLVGQPAPVGIPHIRCWLSQRLEDDHLADLPTGRCPAPASERAQALEIIKQLEGAPATLCHGDASPGNILIGRESRLWLIDPRGFSGEVAYDVAVVASKTSVDLDSLAQAVGVSVDRCNAWATVAKAARV